MTEENAPASETATETPENVEDTPSSGGQAEVTEPKRPSRARERIQALASDKRAAVEMAEFQRKRADELEAKLQSMDAKPSTEPDLSQYDDAAQWAKDYSEWSRSEAKRIAETIVDQKLEASRTKQSQQQLESAFEASMNTAAEQHDDYFDVVLDEQTFMPEALLNVAKLMNNPGEMVYHLAKHPAEARQLAAMNPTAMAAELGRLETKLSKPEPAPNLTNAPEPPSDIGGAAAGEVDLNKVSIDEYMKLRREQLKASRGY